MSCLGGEISPSLLELKYLNYLDLSLNNFGGARIPYFFGMFKNLRYLNLSRANFGGEIPFHLGNLSNLIYLDLSTYNEWRGELDEYEYLRMGKLHVETLQWLPGLTSLRYLDIGGVDLHIAQANWIHVINKLSSLSELHLSNCNISSFDSSNGFSNLTSLRVLDLSDNWVFSLLPLWPSNLTSLTKLDLSGNSFRGTISQDFVKLKNLQYLDISWNYLWNIGDHTPSSLRNLCKLQFLKLAGYSTLHNGGKLDEFLGSYSSNCSQDNLKLLDLSHNAMVGEIPNSLETFRNLQYLDLSYNKLWGSLPNSIGNLSLLQHLDVSGNFLNGTIPSSFGQLSKLIKFDGTGNLWEAVITKAQLVNLTKLEDLAITTIKNQTLVFNVSHDWIPPFKLKTLSLVNCRVGPQFPIWLRVQTQLASVTIINGGLFDYIPNEWISFLSSQIITLDLSTNQLEGNLSHLLTYQDANSNDGRHNVLEDSISIRYLHLTTLNLQHNLLFGPIPSNIGDMMPNLWELNLSDNHLNGTIPSSILKMSHLVILSLSDNQLSGELLKYWSKFKLLYIIDLGNNNLYGKIPSSIGLVTSLDKLILRNNYLCGEIPKTFQSRSLIRSIDLSENRLNGSFTSWIGLAMPHLILLNLRSNFFSGTIIPREWCNLSSLRVLDLSNNNLSGEVPSCLYNWTTFIYENFTNGLDYYHINGSFYSRYLEKTKLVTKGRELEYYGDPLNNAVIINLSRNKLRGEIPNEITKMVHLNILNLSNNEFVGTIPRNIGAMQQLETLDLSCNHLSGTIPTSLASLNFLAHLNLSFNNLTGRIPTGRQLQTLEDPSIYKGNPSLCGSPLLTKCQGDENTNSVPILTSEQDSKENDSEIMLDFYISMAIGFPVGLNIFFFTIFTNELWRISYFRFMDRISHNILEKKLVCYHS